VDGVEDQAVRDRALSAAESFIVQAPAGSGKTELLIQRYLKLLGRVERPEEIIAITFTRKAAAEMRERVLESLRRAAAAESGSDAATARRLALAGEAVANSARLGWDITRQPSRLQIQTIDALSLSLARQLPVLSGFGAPAGIVEDAGAAYRRAAQQALQTLGGGNEDWNRALRLFLLHVDNDTGRAVALIAAMLASRDQWLRHIGGSAVDADSLEAAWRDVVEGWLRRAGELFSHDRAATLVACADRAAAHLAAEGGDSIPPGAAAWRAGDGFPAPRAEELERWRFLAGLLVVQGAPQWRKQVNKNQGLPPGSGAKRTMQGLLAALADDAALARVLFVIRSLPGAALSGDKRDTLHATVAVLKLAVARLQVDFEASGRVDFVEVAQRAIHALGALEDPSDLALKLDYRIQHLLMDELQDTSMTQYHLLRLLTQGWTPEEGRTLFLVGDPMQSIYRFREAEVGIFLNIWERGLDSLALEPLRLRSNFRSAPALVGWVNQAFRRCFAPASDWRSGAVAYAPSTPQRAAGDSGDGVHIHPFMDCPEPAQAEHLAVRVGEALQRTGDVAILVRARSHLRHILPALRAADIPCSGTDITALADVPPVRDLYSLTRALLHPADRMAWLALLRAPWCGLRLEDLLAVAGESRGPLWEVLHDAELRRTLSEDGERRVERFTRALDGAMSQRGRMTLRQWVRRAWLGLDGPALIDAPELDHVETYFSLLASHQAGMHLADERAFHEALHSHWAHAEAPPGAVQLMTMHRAKGLEFDEVFLPGLDRSAPADDKPLLLWEEPVAGGLLLATLSARGAGEDRHYQYLRDLKSQKAAHETDRLLYVSCTRARNRLHLLGNVETGPDGIRAPAAGSLLHRLWPVFEAELSRGASGRQRGAGPREAPPPRAGQPLRRLPSSWQAPALSPALRAAAPAPVDEHYVEFEWAGETARLAGVLVHEHMQRMAADGLARWSRARIDRLTPGWRRRLAHAGVPAPELDAAVRRVGQALRNVLNDGRARWLLRPDHHEPADEYELNVRVGQRVRRLRIDRTFVDDDGVRWVIDYKTSVHEGGDREAFLDREARRYAGQMAAYGDALRGLGSGEIRLGLYFPLLKGWREWPYPSTPATRPE